MSTTDIENRVTHLEGEVRGMQQIAEALFKLSDRMHDELKADIQDIRADMMAMRTELKTDMTAMRTEFRSDMSEMRNELRADVRAGHWERLGIIAAGLTIAASIYFS